MIGGRTISDAGGRAVSAAAGGGVLLCGEDDPLGGREAGSKEARVISGGLFGSQSEQIINTHLLENATRPSCAH